MNLDHNAGGRVRPEVAHAVAELLGRDFGNPSSQHAAGRRARDVIEAAREDVAALVGARPAEVVFTSGGTEANDLAVLGTARPGSHLIASAIEHVSVLRALEAARSAGARSTAIAPSGDGSIDPERVEDALEDATLLVSVGWANGEIGTLQPLAEVVARVRRRRAGRTLVHSDAVQAAGLCAIDFAASGLDLLSLSGHKLGALSGVGALVVGERAGLVPRIHGGPQERGRRAGTENVVGIASFGVAARLAHAERSAFAERSARLRARLWAGLRAAAEPAVRLGPREGLPNTLSVAFPGARGDALVLALDLEGVAASTGAACAAGGAEPSHVLSAIGCDPVTARGALRLSLGRDVRDTDVERAIAIIAAAVGRARAAQPGRGVGRAA